ncbi:hypothetical protein DUT91_15190 [Phyllobacterium salinisoli]|uniref:Uncharacterized protein n=1 Tax=Phyllobacterium salinisoli TaxID=1899321 RepID=A0A368K368_9HYPH|nr:hypothetical protein [Phyllobacterium salinisoli]RCS22842.1 hypothetical protein DUT91_15190 [Phyllobacterium salinisoli]
MKISLAKAFVAAASLASFSLVFDSKARADGWGCQVILCLSNPGGPTQHAECRPPIRKLWDRLAKGRSIPSCSGAGFHSSRPGYDPYSCNEGYKLIGSFGAGGRHATCVSTSFQPVGNRFCSSGRDNHAGKRGSVLSPRWRRVGGRFQCMAQIITRPNLRRRPHYIDVTIEGVGKQRVWY